MAETAKSRPVVVDSHVLASFVLTTGFALYYQAADMGIDPNPLVLMDLFNATTETASTLQACPPSVEGWAKIVMDSLAESASPWL